MSEDPDEWSNKRASWVACLRASRSTFQTGFVTLGVGVAVAIAGVFAHPLAIAVFLIASGVVTAAAGARLQLRGSRRINEATHALRGFERPVLPEARVVKTAVMIDEPEPR